MHSHESALVARSRVLRRKQRRVPLRPEPDCTFAKRASKQASREGQYWHTQSFGAEINRLLRSKRADSELGKQNGKLAC